MRREGSVSGPARPPAIRQRLRAWWRRHRPVSRLGLAMAIAAALTVFIASAGVWSQVTGTTTPTPTPTPPPPILRLGLSGNGATDVATLDPARATDRTALTAVNLIYDGLVTLDANARVEAWAADHITTSADGLIYTFHLRPGLKFSDGVPVKASDYAWAIDRTLSPCFKSPLASYFVAIKNAPVYSGESCSVAGVITPAPGQIAPVVQTLVGTSLVADDGAGNLTITLAQPSGSFLAAMTTSGAYAIERGIVTGARLGADGTWTAGLAADPAITPTGQGGGGMFYVASWDHGGSLILKANPSWWGRGAGKKPHLTEVDLTIEPNTAAAFAAYDQQGRFDFTDAIDPAQLPLVKRKPDFHAVPLLDVTAVTLNWNVAPFNNLDARQAFCLALNRDALNASAFDGAQMPSWHLLPQGLPAYNTQLTGIDGVTATGGDLVQARAHWVAYKDDLRGKPIPPIVLTVTGTSRRDTLLADALIAQWSQAFPDVRVSKATPTGSVNRARAQALVTTWQADYPDPQNMLSLTFAGDSPRNTQGAILPQADDQMARADTIFETSREVERTTLYQSAEQELVTNVATCPILQNQLFYRLRTYVKSFAMDSRGLFPNDAWVTAVIAAH